MLDSDSWTGSQVLTLMVRVWVAVCKSENVKHGAQGKTRNDPKERAIRTSFKIKTQEARAIRELSLSLKVADVENAGEAAKAAKHIGGAVVKIEPGALADGASTVARFQKNYGGAKQALVRYIASFSSKDGLVLGSQQPCRSYRQLILLSEFQEVESKLLSCKNRDEIVACITAWKPHKQALSDLLSMGRSATTRVKSSIKRAEKELEDEAQQKSDRSKRGAKRKGESKSEDVMEIAASLSLSMSSLTWKQGRMGVELHPQPASDFLEPFLVHVAFDASVSPDPLSKTVTLNTCLGEVTLV